MPSAAGVVEELRSGLANGTVRPDEKLHIVFVEREQRKRIANAGEPQPKTKFVMDTDDPLFYSDFHVEKDRIIRHVGNKTVALSLMLRAWQELTEAKMDKWLAEGMDISEIR